ncbi:unnamed protein product [Linum trigynum]|uniref:Uncharacterized protein n=1 Tax=Linum trigynum TaxID=586398 RepID=A0AAV2E2N0_9ROSI
MAAEIILIPVAKQILGKAIDLAMEQIGLLWYFKPELGKLKKTVSTIQAVLRDAEEKQFHNHQVKDWLEKRSDVMYDVDDMLDDISTEARRKAIMELSSTGCCSVVCFLFCSLPKQLAYDLKMAHAIKAVREKLDDITKDKDSLHLEVRNDEGLPLRETDSCPPTIVVGREVDQSNIVQLLLNTNREANISVVPIVGMGGLGKTTLAQVVFDDAEVRAHFEIKVWVHVSQRFDVKVILEKMLQSVNGGSQAGLGLDIMQTRLRESIRGKRFLFALDDVWEENVQSWEALAKYLTAGAQGSKVLVTTRSTKVAEVGGRALKSVTSGSTVLPYPLEGLSTEDSWDLLLKKAGGEIPTNPVVIKTGKEILAKCREVPLSVSAIASVLVNCQYPENEWPLFLQKELSDISDEGNSIMPTLQLSYNQLPSHVKDCFLYCKLLPRGSRLDVQRLVLFWIAQGYIKSEEEGLQCFKVLWWRSFFQEMEMDDRGNMLKCRMHDLMYDLAASVAGTKIVRSCNPTILKTLTSKAHHLAVLGKDDGCMVADAIDNGDEVSDAKKVRTLLSDKHFAREECGQILHNFKRLRVLRMPITDFDTDGYRQLDYIAKLKHLRYLGIRFNLVSNLPNSVTNLLNLEVLDLSEFGNMGGLPEDFGKLIDLKHLLLHPSGAWYLTHMPKGIGELKSLQTLPIFVVGWRRQLFGTDEKAIGVGLDELIGLNALRGELAIIYLADAKFLGIGVYVLKNKLLLLSLVLDWAGPSGMSHGSTNEEEILAITLHPPPNLKKLEICGGYGGVTLPDWLAHLVHLVEIKLEDCKKCEYLPPLHQLPSLKKLQIKYCTLLKGMNFQTGDRFPCLAYLYIGHCPALSQMPAFPTLETQLELEETSLEGLERTTKVDKNLHPHSRSSSSAAAIVLRPLSKLTKLTLGNTDGSMEYLPEDGWSGLVSLQLLSLSSLSGCVKLPSGLGSISSLTDIRLHWCGALEFLPPLHQLPILMSLVIKWCPKLKGWWKKGSDHNNDADDHDHYYCSSSTSGAAAEEEEEEWPHFPSLSRLEISGCPKLTHMPLFPTVKGLELKKTSSRVLLRTMKMKVADTDDNPKQHPLSKLTYMVLEDIDDLESLPEEGFRNLTSLRVLKIVDCRSLASLPQAIRHLTSLKQLIIRECPSLTVRLMKGYGQDWHTISHIPDLEV